MVHKVRRSIGTTRIQFRGWGRKRLFLTAGPRPAVSPSCGLAKSLKMDLVSCFQSFRLSCVCPLGPVSELSLGSLCEGVDLSGCWSHRTCAGVVSVQHNETAILFRESALSATAALFAANLVAHQRHGKSSYSSPHGLMAGRRRISPSFLETAEDTQQQSARPQRLGFG